MEQTTRAAEELITRWDVDGSAYSKITSLFYESREEAHLFLRRVVDLNAAMRSSVVVVSERTTSDASRRLAHAHRLIVSAMARLEKEFFQILSANRSHLDTDSIVSSSLEDASDGSHGGAGDGKSATAAAAAAAAMDDLRSIADCMLTCGYSKECVKTYTKVRKTLIAEGLLRLGHVPETSSHVRKLDWDATERRVRRWVAASRPAVTSLFSGERFLCEHVFGSSPVKEAIFAEVTTETAVRFLRFPELVGTKRKASPEKIFLFLDLYDSTSYLYPELESLFPNRSPVLGQARASLGKLGRVIGSLLVDFEKSIQKDSTKGNVAGGGIHPLTKYVMNYLTFLADYAGILRFILPTSKSFSRDGVLPLPSPEVSSRVAWLLLLLLGKLDKKAEAYHDGPLSYLFLANNVTYVVKKVRSSSNLRRLLGEEWVTKQTERARWFSDSYERLAWRAVVEAIPADVERLGVAALEERMAEFRLAFDEACRTQRSWVVKDRSMRDELKVSIAGKLMVPYRVFYDKYVTALGTKEKDRHVAALDGAKFTPDDIWNYLSDLFFGAPPASPSGSSRSSGSRSKSIPG